ncbi:MAG: GH3 auxin-responsive promoter family protein [Phycisphaeraceae bacterium]|nr:GH3 auxin-responsive promoter family protein [Phycisphaeraceae bacterium]
MAPTIQLLPDLPPGPARFRDRPSWTTLIGAGLRTYLTPRARKLADTRFWRSNTHAIQRKTLRDLLRTAAPTRFGRENKFAALASTADAELIDAYRKSFPVRDWYSFKDQIARMREGGEPDVLWPGLVRDFAQTSGTTAGDKFIPVSAEMMRSNFRASLDIFAHLANQNVKLASLLTGKCLFLGGSTNLDTNSHGIRTGDLSGLVTPLIRWPISSIYLPGPEVALMSHWPSKIEAMALRCINEDVRMISGMPSWAMVLAERLIELARARGITSRVPGEDGVPITTLRQVWPNLTLFVHGGVRYQPFDPRVRQVYSGSPTGADIAHRFELYPASEAFIAMQDAPNPIGAPPGSSHPSLRLNADLGNYFEFVPIERINDPDPEAFSADQVEKGQRYCVILTTCAGLWRYNIGDVVEFDGICDGPDRRGDGPSRLRIVGRHRHFVNAFGENLIVEHIETAVAEAARAADFLVGEFTAAPVYPSGPRRAGLELAIEIESKPEASGGSLERFRDAFDASLKKQNVDYTTKRTDGVGMSLPTITPLRPGAFHRWLESRGKLGGQHKCPRCANSRELLEQIVQFSGDR